MALGHRDCQGKEREAGDLRGVAGLGTAWMMVFTTDRDRQEGGA